jgi:hypothetical protein
MDLFDFESDGLYFDAPQPEHISRLLMQASALYGQGEAELYLLQAYFIAPENLSVLVALYRYYYFQHRLEEALIVAERTMIASGEILGFPEDWRKLSPFFLGRAVVKSMGLVRFYLLALKAAGCVGLRLGRIDTAREMLAKVRELDHCDRLGAEVLIQIVDSQPRPELRA